MTHHRITPTGQAMGLGYIRLTYRVPAYRGHTIEYTDGQGKKRAGEIKSARGAHLRVLLDGDKRPVSLHPTWNVIYLGA